MVDKYVRSKDKIEINEIEEINDSVVKKEFVDSKIKEDVIDNSKFDFDNLTIDKVEDESKNIKKFAKQSDLAVVEDKSVVGKNDSK